MVKSLEFIAPSACKVERDILYQKLQLGKIFGIFGPNHCKQIWKEIFIYSSIRLIPIFYSFFKDFKYL